MLEAPRPWSGWYKPHRLIGRFALLRACYGRLRRLEARLWRPPAGGGATLFPDLSARPITEDLRRDGFHAGFWLPTGIVQHIQTFARGTACTRPGFDESFVLAAVQDGRLADGGPIAIADVRRPLDCPAVATIAADNGLRGVAAAYLGYAARRVETRLWWSLAVDLPDDARRALRQTIDFHYDVPWFNAVYAYFYLTEVTEQSGAHVIYRGSARCKPWRFLLSSAFQNDGALDAFYGPSRRVVVTGPAGYGFFADPFAFHKALAPLVSDRLILQLRYY
jgi:hypothetical protein